MTVSADLRAAAAVVRDLSDRLDAIHKRLPELAQRERLEESSVGIDRFVALEWERMAKELETPA